MTAADFEKLIAYLESFRAQPKMYLGDVTVMFVIPAQAEIQHSSSDPGFPPARE